MKLKEIIHNYINGNLTEAKEGAKTFSLIALQRKLYYTYGYSLELSTTIARYLKEPSQESYDAVCAQELEEKK